MDRYGAHPSGTPADLLGLVILLIVLVAGFIWFITRQVRHRLADGQPRAVA